MPVRLADRTASLLLSPPHHVFLPPLKSFWAALDWTDLGREWDGLGVGRSLEGRPGELRGPGGRAGRTGGGGHHAHRGGAGTLALALALALPALALPAVARAVTGGPRVGRCHGRLGGRGGRAGIHQGAGGASEVVGGRGLGRGARDGDFTPREEDSKEDNDTYHVNDHRHQRSSTDPGGCAGGLGVLKSMCLSSSSFFPSRSGGLNSTTRPSDE
jgi:hypothetical protein